MLLLSVLGCSTSGRSTSAGPLKSLSDGATLCLYEPTSTPVTDAQDILDRVYPGRVVLKSISLVGARNIETSGVALLPLTAGIPEIGAAFPPFSHRGAPTDWTQRVAVNQLSTERGPLTIVLGVKVTGSRGSALGTRVVYSANGQEYTVTTTTKLIISRKVC
jgi:hypothetical protein